MPSYLQRPQLISDASRTDEELVTRSRGGDVDSFNQLILRWERPIYALAYRVIGREEDARDVCQETFLRAYRSLAGFKGQAKFSSWLYRIALNLCRDWIRRQRRAPVSQFPEDMDILEAAAATEPTESIEDLVARRELSAVVEEAMALLPDEQRTAIILKEYHGMTFQEIADLQGCPLSTVKTRLYQGLSVLRRQLERQGQAVTTNGEATMNDINRCPNHELLVAYLYDECEPAERESFATHLALCASCAEELQGLRDARVHLAAWSPPALPLGFQLTRAETISRRTSCTRQGLPAEARRAKGLSAVARWAKADGGVSRFRPGRRRPRRPSSSPPG